MQLSKKLNIFSEIFTAFPKSTFNFEHLERRDHSHGLCISQIIDCERRSYVNVQRVKF